MSLVGYARFSIARGRKVFDRRVVAQFEFRDRYGPRGPGAGVASSTSPTIQSMS